MPDKLGADIVNINDKLKENVKDIGKLNQSIQMSQETNDNKLEEIDSSIKQQKIERMAQAEGIRKKCNELKGCNAMDLNEVNFVQME